MPIMFFSNREQKIPCPKFTGVRFHRFSKFGKETTDMDSFEGEDVLYTAAIS